jgi:class 3 adenylate cyclase
LASGVETGEGTALRITSGITEDSEQDAYQTILNGANSASRLQAQAQADRITGSNAATAETSAQVALFWLPAGLHMMAGKLKRLWIVRGDQNENTNG